MQVIGGPLPETGHDFCVHLIITPGEVIECGPQRRPAGLDWEHLSAEKIAAIRVLAARASRVVLPFLPLRVPWIPSRSGPTMDVWQSQITQLRSLACWTRRQSATRPPASPIPQSAPTTMVFALWADDAEWVIGGTENQPFERRVKGIDDIVSLFRKLRDDRDYFVQFAVQGSIEINGDEATARCVCHEAARGPGESYYRNNGVWTDRLRRSDNGWVFTSRTYQYLWLDLSPFSGNIFTG
jgi:hypothetical protein